MKIGINSYTANNNFELIDSLYQDGLIDMYECSKHFYKKNRYHINKLQVPCETFSSLIVGEYDLTDNFEFFLFVEEFEETIKMAKDVGATKLMFGLAKYRTNLSSNHHELFNMLVDIAKNNGMTLLYEAISPDLHKNEFITNHDELIKFSREHGINEIHVDFGTLRSNNENFRDIAKKIKISNIHFPYGEFSLDEVKDHDISIENYSSEILSAERLSDYLNYLKNLN